MRQPLKTHGFKKRGLTWRLAAPETILVFNVQRSRFGPTYFLNCGVYLRGAGNETAPSEHVCHIRTRIQDSPDVESMLERALDFESQVPVESRDSILREAVTSRAIPWLQARDSDAKVRTVLSGSESSEDRITLEAKRYLGFDAA